MPHSPITTLARAAACAAILTATALPAAAQETSAARPRPFAAFTGSAQLLRDSLVAVARAQVGKPYRLGGRSPRRGFDCSGLIQYILSTFERELPRTAAQQGAFGLAIERDTSRLRPGDLVTFGRGARASHVGIYVGDGRFVHASSVAGRVVESRIDRRAERVKPWRGARRIVAASDETLR